MIEKHTISNGLLRGVLFVDFEIKRWEIKSCVVSRV